MSIASGERRLTTILVADIVGYSRMMGVDEEGTLNALRAHREVAVGLIATHRGLVFSGVGDSMVAEFPGWLNPDRGVVKAVVEF